MRKRIGIEEFLSWAYRDELPKAQPEGGLVGPESFRGCMGGVQRVEELGTLVDVPDNRYGVVANRWAADDPHPDAVLAAEAVEGLDRMVVDLPDDWNPLADMGDLGPLGAVAIRTGLRGLVTLDAAGRRTLRSQVTPRRLVFRHALMRDAPDWEGEAPTVALTRGANGKPLWFRRAVVEGEAGPYEIEVDGMDRKRRIPMPDAYQKPYLDPCPVDTIIGRGEYEIWRSALDLLHEDLAPHLAAFDLQPCSRPQRPWEAPAAPTRRVFHIGFQGPHRGRTELEARLARPIVQHQA
ncbi:hypothetical protein [Methylobacterium oryzihabitans]|uniref:Uncharacterized protein n=1 Tax=Methylobacterium oryzihabitans TaxID=2499852 RepID=A0A3S3U152_9HYPH|nr:hypothetical protein [Methylobacterium oryzihabitans]RVU13150.1 hypothetical protein EOE48_26950 [Methylobacterium oryzihabitans]